MNTKSNTQAHTNTQMNTHTHTHTHSHTHTHPLSISLSLSVSHTHIHTHTLQMEVLERAYQACGQHLHMDYVCHRWPSQPEGPRTSPCWSHSSSTWPGHCRGQPMPLPGQLTPSWLTWTCDCVELMLCSAEWAVNNVLCAEAWFESLFLMAGCHLSSSGV